MINQSIKKCIYVVYDGPKNKCDKLWVIDGLTEQGYQVKPVWWPFRISHLDQRGRIGAYLAMIAVFIQCIWVVTISGENDIIFCWLQRSGIFLNKLAGKRRKIISFNWLTPEAKEKTRSLYANALSNPNFRAVVNAKENIQNNLKYYQVTDANHMCYIPDVFDQNCVWKIPQFCKKDMSEQITKATEKYQSKYCFMGGRANRDWKLFLEAARLRSNYCFVGVAAASDFDKNTKIPQNVIMMYDISAEEYYEWMRNAYIGVFPLNENKVSGLINILKGTMEGIPVLVTRLDVTAMYYPDEYKNLLFEIGNVESVCQCIDRMYSLNEYDYIKTVTDIQKFVNNQFSPTMAINKIVGMIHELE